MYPASCKCTLCDLFFLWVKPVMRAQHITWDVGLQIKHFLKHNKAQCTRPTHRHQSYRPSLVLLQSLQVIVSFYLTRGWCSGRVSNPSCFRLKWWEHSDKSAWPVNMQHLNGENYPAACIGHASLTVCDALLRQTLCWLVFKPHD